MSRFTSSTEPPKEPPSTDPPSNDPPLPPKEAPTDGAPSGPAEPPKPDVVETPSVAAQSTDIEVVFEAPQAPFEGLRAASLTAESVNEAPQAPGPAPSQLP